MGVFSRISDILKSNINDLLDKAEDPEKMVKQIIIDMQKELTIATQNLGKAKASERLAQKKMDDAVKVAAGWEAKAKAALSQGNQDMAKQALAKKVRADEEVATYTEMYESISTQTDAIENQVEVLKSKLDEAKSRQAMLIARSQMADTKKALAKSQGGFDGASALEKFDRMEEKIQRKEAEADAFAEIGGTDDELVESFDQIEKDAKVDAELARLMAEMNGGAAE
ncbi:MAG: PspA/IM30 family protein [Ruminococcus sp.]|nr:PspA/IM30 family protein [Ruminococcus sp.]MBR6581185.1 PspA/IM30 family protein [Ruminococcus sp.]